MRQFGATATGPRVKHYVITHSIRIENREINACIEFYMAWPTGHSTARNFLLQCGIHLAQQCDAEDEKKKKWEVNRMKYLI